MNTEVIMSLQSNIYTATEPFLNCCEIGPDLSQQQHDKEKCDEQQAQHWG